MTLSAWPEQRPDVPPCLDGWFDGVNADILSQFIGPGAVVVEIGSWMGKSTLWLAEKVGPAGHVYAVDHFKGSAEHQADPRLPTLWETFVVNCWDRRDRITPVRADSRVGLLDLYHRGVWPAVVYVDGSHDYHAAARDILLGAFLWADAQIVGDDYWMPSVRQAALDAGRVLGRAVDGNDRCFSIKRGTQ